MYYSGHSLFFCYLQPKACLGSFPILNSSPSIHFISLPTYFYLASAPASRLPHSPLFFSYSHPPLPAYNTATGSDAQPPFCKVSLNIQSLVLMQQLLSVSGNLSLVTNFTQSCKNNEQIPWLFSYFLHYGYELNKAHIDISQVHLYWTNLELHSRYPDSASSAMLTHQSRQKALSKELLLENRCVNRSTVYELAQNSF